MEAYARMMFLHLYIRSKLWATVLVMEMSWRQVSTSTSTSTQ
jgi:hypothetical protein